MRLTKRRARIIRSAINFARAQAGADGKGARVLAENIQDMWGRAYDRARYRPSAVTQHSRKD